MMINLIKTLKRFALRFSAIREIRENRGGSNIDLLDGSDPILLERNKPVFIKWPEKIKKPYIGLVKDHPWEKRTPYTAYWPKFERFLKNNNFNYEFYNIHASNWMNNAKKFDQIIWRINSDPASLDEAREKILIIENIFKIPILPSFNEIWSNEDKVKTYQLLSLSGIPQPETFISYDPLESMKYAKNAILPVVTKLRTGSGSKGVQLLRSRSDIIKHVRSVFKGGNQTYWPYLNQFGYVYFQEFIKYAKYDLRVIVIGNHAFGYYRYPNHGDFRASGSGNLKKGQIPIKALDLAFKTNSILKRRMVAIDMIKDAKGKYLVIEASSFFRVDDGIELEINGSPGMYVKKGNNYKFVKGKYWVQELLLRDILINYYEKGVEI